MSEAEKQAGEKEREIELLRRLTAEKRQEQGPGHPPDEWLTAYHSGTLPARDRKKLQEHLAVCPDCTRELLDLQSFCEEVEEEARRVLPPPPPSLWERWIEWFRIPSISRASMVAAGLFGCVVGVTPGLLLHRQQPPAPPLWIHNVAVRGETPGETLTIDLPAPGSALPLVWQVPEEPRFAAYRVEIQTLGRQTLLSAPTAPMAVAAPLPAGESPPRLVAVEIPPERLARGEYRLVLIGLPREQLDEKIVRVR